MTAAQPSHLGSGLTGRQPVDLTYFRSISLTELVSRAALLHRTDRKYLADGAQAQAFLDASIDSHQVLAIARRRSTTYCSTYFDTDRWTACRDHVQGRRRRWKIRRRLYVEDGLCRIEVKTKDGRGRTDKVSMDVDSLQHRGALTNLERAFIRDTLGPRGVEVDVDALSPSAEVSYERASLTDSGCGTRITLDWGLRFASAHGEVWLDSDHVLIETKGSVRPSSSDRLLWRSGLRPQGLSKYTAGVSLLAPGIADNDVRSLLGKALHRSPAVRTLSST
jgi:hypothetical protein